MEDNDLYFEIAAVCHAANKAYCHTIGDHSQVDFFEAPTWQVESAINGVKFALNNPDAPASSQHDAWLSEKVAGGWVYGDVKDANAKTHPCCVPYDQLPIEQQCKDTLFKAIVKALS